MKITSFLRKNSLKLDIYSIHNKTIKNKTKQNTMENLHISTPNPMNVQDLQDILECVMAHSEFYTETSPQLINLHNEGFSLVFDELISDDDRQNLCEAIEIDLPVQAKFTI